ncbi:sensor histidine kinase [Rubrivirga sp.]|uniref:sensor histidine kinase n=1 Tax=Rubrivirga sp. TaxID=1885344 RepID=UPI003B522CB0
MPISRTRLYWICQLAGWALGLGAFLLLVALTGGFIGPTLTPAAIVYSLVLVYGLGVGGTHAVHVVAVRRGWLDLPLRALAPRLVVAVVVAAVAAVAVSTALSMAVEPLINPLAEHPEPFPSLAVFFSNVLSTIPAFLAWAAVYALIVTGLRLSDAERDRLRLRATLAEGRMRALEYQLNPHALFNALNTVRALILEDPAEARRAVTLLSGLLRRTLAAGREATHALADELELVRTTLAIEAIRFEDRLRVRLDVPTETRDLAVPALLVQTLVENAVKHGVARCREGGEVSVEARVEDGRLTLRVENPLADGPRPEGTGTGLANARERLGLLYGDDARLALDLDGDRAVATVTLPALVASPTPTDA